MALAQANVPAETIVVGNTLRARQLAFTVNGESAAIASARFAVAQEGVRIYAAACVVAGEVVTRPVVPAATTAKWPAGSTLFWDLEVTLASGEERTWVRGPINLLPTAQ